MNQRELLGTLWSPRRLADDRFRCPHCRRERGCSRTSLQRQLAVLGRPVAQLGAPEHFHTCHGCGHAYLDGAGEAPLNPDGDREWVLSEDELALLATVAAMVFSDSVVRRAEKEVARAVVRHYLGHGPPGGIDEVLRHARRRWGDPVPRLRRLRHLVPEDNRLRIIQAAYHVCTADGELHREESRFLDRVGDALDLSPRRIRRALGDARRRPVA